MLFYLHLRISRRQFPVFDAELNISDNPTLPISIQDKTFIFIRLPEEDANSQLSKNDPHSRKYKLFNYAGLRFQFCNILIKCPVIILFDSKVKYC